MPRAHPPQVGLLDGDHVPPRDHRERSEQGRHATWQRHRPLGQAPTLHRILHRWEPSSLRLYHHFLQQRSVAPAVALAAVQAEGPRTGHGLEDQE